MGTLPERNRGYKTAIGLMSGTSLDGVDAALIKTDGRYVEDTGHWLTVNFPADLRRDLLSLIKTEAVSNDVEKRLTELHADAVKRLLVQASLTSDEVDVIGFHGQTIFHKPNEGITCQIGDGMLLAQLTGISVVNDFRSNDVREGGQGAPLIPLYHAAITREIHEPVAVVNIGGIANVTFIDWSGKELEFKAFDTGPGNILLNKWADQHLGTPIDHNGELALKGKVVKARVDQFLKHPYFQNKGVKSLDREAFTLDAVEGLNAQDGAATLVAVTAETILLAFKNWDKSPIALYVTGGGRLNPAIMKYLSEHAPCKVETVEALGEEGDALEAQGFAYLAVRSLKKLPITYPSITGVKEPLTGGAYYPA